MTTIKEATDLYDLVMVRSKQGGAVSDEAVNLLTSVAMVRDLLIRRVALIDSQIKELQHRRDDLHADIAVSVARARDFLEKP